MKALIVVDVQNDFIPGGHLPVKEGDQIVPLVDKLVKLPFDVIVATKDWHPSDHGSFAPIHRKQPGQIIQLEGIDQILWPVHCIQNTVGADFVPGWDVSRVHHVFMKGTDPKIDSYSTFFDNARRRSTGLEEYLREKGVTEVYLAGLATDYCVRYSALDALDLGFDTYVIADACRGINLEEGDVERTLAEIQILGGHVVSFDDVVEQFAKSGS